MDTTNNKQPKRRRIQFRPTVTVVKIPPISAFSQDEIESTWYTREEFHQRRQHLKVVTTLLNGVPNCAYLQQPPTTSVCTHGLLSTRERDERREIIDTAVDAVLMEQEYQDNEMIYEPETLADVYFMFTRDSQWEACERAHHHAMDIIQS